MIYFMFEHFLLTILVFIFNTWCKRKREKNILIKFVYYIRNNYKIKRKMYGMLLFIILNQYFNDTLILVIK